MKIKPKLKVGGNVFDVVFVSGEAIDGIGSLDYAKSRIISLLNNY